MYGDLYLNLRLSLSPTHSLGHTPFVPNVKEFNPRNEDKIISLKKNLIHWHGF
jgi:hypothetical protein